MTPMSTEEKKEIEDLAQQLHAVRMQLAKKPEGIGGLNGPWRTLLKVWLALFMPCVAIVLGACWWVVSQVGELNTKTELATSERAYLKETIRDLKHDIKELSQDVEDIKKGLDK